MDSLTSYFLAIPTLLIVSILASKGAGRCVIALIRRQDDVLVPRGSTRIEPGEALLVLAERATLDQIRALVNNPGVRQTRPRASFRSRGRPHR